MQTWQHFQFKCQESLCTAQIGEVITSPVRPGKNIYLQDMSYAADLNFATD